MRLAVCIPFKDTVTRTRFCINLREMELPVDFKLFNTIRMYYDRSRNIAAKEALDWGASHLLFLDDDMLHPSDVYYRLRQYDVPIVGALYFQRNPPHVSCMFRYDSEGYLCTVNGGIAYQGLQAVESVGTGCMLVQSRVFKNLPYPWFIYNDWSLGLKLPELDAIITEDVGFCIRVRRAGYPVYCDTNLVIPHLGYEETITEKTHMEHYNGLRASSDSRRGCGTV